jgi:hypothetical protein
MAAMDMPEDGMRRRSLGLLGACCPCRPSNGNYVSDQATVPKRRKATRAASIYPETVGRRTKGGR